MVMLQARAAEDFTARFRLTTIQQQRDSFALQVQAQAALRQENDNLRALITMRQRLSQPYVAAEVLHRPSATDERMLLVSAGAAEGASPFTAVVTADGLLGVVWSVGQGASSVMTWAHPEFRASAVTGDGAVSGMVQASAEVQGRQPLLQLRGVAMRDSLALGTVVYTSGLGGVFPRGVPIGTVAAVGLEEMGYERIYQLRPFVNPGRVSHVLLLTAPRDSVFLTVPGGGDGP
jgi:rod shape-determining protein MreC